MLCIGDCKSIIQNQQAFDKYTLISYFVDEHFRMTQNVIMILQNNLDEKTEKIALLEDEVSAKNKFIFKLENELKELNKKLR